MKTYKLLLTIPTVVDIEAYSEEDAVERLKNSLIASGQLKPADIIKVQVIQS